MVFSYLKEQHKFLLSWKFKGLSCAYRKHLIIYFLAFFFSQFVVNAQVGEKSKLSQLRILQNDQHPIAYFFRDAEQVGRQQSTSWNEWYSAYNSLMGVIGKALPEEVTVGDFEQVRNYFNRLKDLHPEQAVILHICGRARDPEFATEPFFAGHWLYYEGTTILNNMSAEEGTMKIEVSDIGLFKTNVGPRGRKTNEHIGICELDTDGKPNWLKSEQVKLIDIDYENNKITIERGCFGTKPKEFKAGKSYAAAHVYEGPQGAASNNLRWYYNHSTLSPRDKNGKQASEVYAEQIAEWFQKDSLLAKFDGLEFDVLHHVSVPTASDGREIDYNADGKADKGLCDNYPTYGIGAINFLKTLRQLLGDEILIMADNDRWFHQRSVGVLNGIEHEKFPTGGDDSKFEDWAGGINRLKFWKVNSKEPVFNYIKSKPDDSRIADIRLAFAAAVICEAGISMTVPGGRNRLDEDVFIWDELKKGQDNQLGWLGKPIGPIQRLASKGVDLLSGVDLKTKIISANCSVEFDEDKIRLSRNHTEQGFMKFTLGDFKFKGHDLFVTATVNGKAMNNYPNEFARIMYLEVTGGPKVAFEGDIITNYSLVQDKTFERVISNMSHFNHKPFRAGFYFRQFNSPTELTFNFEGNEQVTISDLEVYSAPDVMVRKYEGGLVIANPSEHDVTINLGEILPGEKFRRLKGSPDQDPLTNNGELVEGKVTLGKLDGLFLLREN